MKVKITVHVPTENADTVRDSIGRTGAGTIGEYSYCSFTTKGVGRFIPSSNAKPHIGDSGKLEIVEEESIEVVCDREIAKKVVQVIKNSHPYEELAFEIIELLDEKDL